MAHLYIADELSHATVGSVVLLEGAEARHAASVSRLRVGESVMITNGRGLLVDAEATIVTKDRVELKATAVSAVPIASPEITLVQALAKGDRDERAIEMATELGVSVVVPWQATRSISRWEGDKAVKGQARWASIVREASKQAIRAWIPEVTQVVSTKTLCADGFEGLTLVLDPSGQTGLGSALDRHRVRARQGVRLVVGPEGGISDEELTAFSASNAVIVGLGSFIMRTSTAGPAAVAVLNQLLGRW